MADPHPDEALAADRASRDRRLVEQAASIAVGLVVAAIREGAANKAASPTRSAQATAAALEPTAAVLEARSGQIVDAVARAVLGAPRV